MLSLISKTHCTTWGLVTWVVGDGTSAEEGVVWTGSRVHLNGLLGTCSEQPPDQPLGTWRSSCSQNDSLHVG